MKKIVKNKIETVNVFLKRKSTEFVVLEEETQKRFLMKPKHFPRRVVQLFNLNWHGRLDSNYTTVENFSDEGLLYVEGDFVYYHPHVEITTTSGKIHSKFFPTPEELKSFLDNELAGIEYVEL